MTGKPSSGWAVELTGDKIDLDDLRELLEPPFDPSFEDYDDGSNIRVLLRSQAWTAATDSSAVMAQAAKIAERLHGAMLLIHDDARPLAVGQVFKFRDDGTRENIIICATGHMKLRGGRVRGRGIVGSSGPPPPPQPSPIQAWIKAAETNDDQADLLDHLGRADNWYDIYKAAEIIRRMAKRGGGLAAMLGPLKTKWERVWQTANVNRHAPDPVKYPLPPVPATLDEAREAIFDAAKRLG